MLLHSHTPERLHFFFLKFYKFGNFVKLSFLYGWLVLIYLIGLDSILVKVHCALLKKLLIRELFLFRRFRMWIIQLSCTMTKSTPLHNFNYFTNLIGVWNLSQSHSRALVKVHIEVLFVRLDLIQGSR